MSIFKKYRNSKGFTLVELLVVIAIIGILATLVLLQLGTARAKAIDAKRIADVSQLRTASELYFDDHAGSYPQGPLCNNGATAADCTGAPQNPGTQTGNVGPYLSGPSIPLDPLTNSNYGYAYDNVAATPHRYQVWSELERKAPAAFAADTDINSTIGGTCAGTAWCGQASFGAINGTLETCLSPTAVDCVYDVGQQ